MATASKREKSCDGFSVGVVVVSGARVLIGLDPRGGWSGGAGHIYDEFNEPREAAEMETWEEFGVSPDQFFHMEERRLPNHCLRGSGPEGPGHQWHVYLAVVETQDLDIDERSFAKAQWVTRQVIQYLAEYTVNYARREVSTASWDEKPGLLPVWVLVFAMAQIIELSEDDLLAVERFLDDGER
ncbi:NUDIX domain-containing protein [Actinomadura sp. B10D3]|uniref:NUDIX domain-containing protein n=1 Tax=Actinomadura sp. B10D3 TaxID=3153557 RepID=UPI00325F0E0E